MLTIGMAHYNDPSGVQFTVQALAMYRGFADIEVLVVDNSPHLASGQHVAKYCAKWADAGYPVRYVPMAEPCGTCPPRQRVFDEAAGEFVCCIDCHVLFPPGVIDRLVQFYRDNPDCCDLLQGPCLRTEWTADPWNPEARGRTHFRDVWAAGMRGKWGYDPRGRDPGGDPFEIQAQGLGLFACQRDAFCGFSPHFRGFGGGEWYIHEKMRRRGHRAVCVPWLRWWHRFGYPMGVPYWADKIHQMRNYILGHLELGWSTDPIYQHFVVDGEIPQDYWDHIMVEPIHRLDVPRSTIAPGTMDLEALAALDA